MKVWQSLAIMAAGGLGVVLGGLYLHQARAADLKAPPGAWEIVGVIHAVEDPETKMDLGPWSPDGKTHKYFKDEADCQEFMKTPGFKKTEAEMKAFVKATFKPPAVLVNECRQDGDPI